MSSELITVGKIDYDNERLIVELCCVHFKTNKFVSVYTRAVNENYSIEIPEDVKLTPKIQKIKDIGDLDAYGSSSFLSNIIYYSSPTTIETVAEKIDISVLDSNGNKVPFVKPFGYQLEELIVKDFKGEINLKKHTRIMEIFNDNKEYSKFYLDGLDVQHWYEAPFDKLIEAKEFVEVIQQGKFTFDITVVPKHTIEVPNETYNIDIAKNMLHNYSGELDVSKLTDEDYIMEVCKDIMYKTTLPFIKEWFSDEMYDIALEKANKLYDV